MSESFPSEAGSIHPKPSSGGGEALEVQLTAAHRALCETEKRLGAASLREALLQAELQHRVRNILAIVRSIFSRTVASGSSLEDIADHFGGRLDTISRYQSFQAVSSGVTVDFEQLVRDELSAFQFGDDPSIAIDGIDTRIGQEVAQLAALAVHELVTNSIKFGTLSGTDSRARLRISWTTREDRLRFEWAESGIAVLGAAPLRRGFGREYIEQALPYQLGAESTFDLRPGGLTCIITIPLDAVAARVV